MQNYDPDSNKYSEGDYPAWSIVTPCASGCLYGFNSLSSGSMAISTEIQNCKHK